MAESPLKRRESTTPAARHDALGPRLAGQIVMGRISQQTAT
jgi:hypothetical protein